MHGSDPCGLRPVAVRLRPSAYRSMGGGSARGGRPARTGDMQPGSNPGPSMLHHHPSVAQRTRALGFGPRSCAGSNPAGGSRGEARARASPAGCNPVASGFGGSTPSLPTLFVRRAEPGARWLSYGRDRVGSNPALAILRSSSRGRSSTEELPVVIRAVPVQVRPVTLTHQHRSRWCNGKHSGLQSREVGVRILAGVLALGGHGRKAKTRRFQRRNASSSLAVRSQRSSGSAG